MSGVRARHLSDAELDELLLHCVEFLWERRTGPSPIEGWQYSAGGIRPWWERAGELDSETTRRRVRPLREDVYDLLEERGWIVKGVGNNVPIHVAPPQSWSHGDEAGAVITVSATGAGYGDPITNAAVERAAMAHVIDAYKHDGWSCHDVSGKNLGWDVTVTRGRDEWHLEVKGVSGSKARCLLTRNEHETAGTDTRWRLAVVVLALTDPVLHEFDAPQAVAVSKPHVYKLDLT